MILKHGCSLSCRADLCRSGNTRSAGGAMSRSQVGFQSSARHVEDVKSDRTRVLLSTLSTAILEALRGKSVGNDKVFVPQFPECGGISQSDPLSFGRECMGDTSRQRQEVAPPASSSMSVGGSNAPRRAGVDIESCHFDYDTHNNCDCAEGPNGIAIT